MRNGKRERTKFGICPIPRHQINYKVFALTFFIRPRLCVLLERLVVDYGLSDDDAVDDDSG